VYQRAQCAILERRLREPRRFIQVLLGPRQTGKTTIARQACEACGAPFVNASADRPELRSAAWIEQMWDQARVQARSPGPEGGTILVLDEIHKVPGWADTVKALWDEDAFANRALKVVLLGSSPWAIRRGLGDSLGGRFEVVPVGHWSFAEMRDAFGWDIDRFVCFGGYPGAAPLVDEPERWASYIQDALIETTLSRDILLMTRVDKPALLRRLFDLASACSGTILSYQKMLGQLQDAGNTTTLAHYLELLSGAGIVCGLDKFAGNVVRQRASSPKLQVFNNALVGVRLRRSPVEVRHDPELWGRLCESAVGAHLVNARVESGVEVFYWRERGFEVDFVVRRQDEVTAIEVKSGRTREARRGTDAFAAAFKPDRRLLVGTGGIPFEEFLSAPLTKWA